MLPEKVTYLNLNEYIGKKNVVLFGVSPVVGECLNILDDSISVLYMCDNDEEKQGRTLFGLRIESPEKLKHESKESKENLVVIIISSCYAEIIPQVLDAGIKNIKIYSDLFKLRKNKRIIIPNIRFGDEDFYIDIDDEKTVNNLARLFDSIEDEPYSKKLLYYVVKNRISNRPREKDPNFNMTEDYTYFAIPLLHSYKENEIVIDGGLMDGDDFKHFYGIFGNRLKKIYGFEPGKKEFGRASADIKHIDVIDGRDLVKKSISEIVDIKIYPYALSDKSETLYFSEFFTSDKSDFGYEVEARSIDGIVDPTDKITLIKMDVEGAEMSALRGAEKTIVRHKPRLLICLYHKSNDLWEIPLYIKSLCPDYKLYIRPHGAMRTALEVHAVCD